MTNATALPSTDDLKLKRAIAELTKLPRGTAPSREQITDLLDGWGPDPMAPDVTFLEGVGRGAAGTNASILECGAGPTTVLCAAIGCRRGVKVCALEGSTPTRARVTKVAEDLGLAIQFYDGPAQNYGRLIWYDPPFNRLPAQLWPTTAGQKTAAAR